MKRDPLSSGAVRSAGYHAETGTLELEFGSGSVYRYFEVPASVYEWLLRAESKGAYVSRVIADRFRFERVVEGPQQDIEAALRASLDRPS